MDEINRMPFALRCGSVRQLPATGETLQEDCGRSTRAIRHIAVVSLQSTQFPSLQGHARCLRIVTMKSAVDILNVWLDLVAGVVRKIEQKNE